MYLRKLLLPVLFTCSGWVSLAQQPASPYPQNYFRNPLDIPILLAGNFGECRPGHFHSGIDIKTNGKENLVVHAAADGYISRIKMEKGGFGHALYVKHPNGYTTLYAHLNDFVPELQKLLKAEQYKNESWQVDIVLDSMQYPVKKGQQIAWSGNTGASTAPHLHFEIRNTTTEHPLNPMLFGLPIVDKIPPKPEQIAIYDLRKGVYQQDPEIITLHKKGNVYVPSKDTIKVYTPEPALGINVNDFMNGSTNTLGYYTASVYMNNAMIITVRLDDIGYDETRYLHAFSDYKTKKLKGIWMQCLFEQLGNGLSHIYEYTSSYRRFSERGRLEANIGQVKTVRIDITDASGNKSTVSFLMQFNKPTDLPPVACDKKNLFNVNKANSFSNTNVAFVLDEKALYETMCFEFDRKRDADSYSDRFGISKSYIPVHTRFDLYLKPDKPVPFDLRDKIAAIYNDGTSETGMGMTNDDDWYKASVRNFGEYRLVADTIPPAIKSLQKENAVLTKAGAISFSATETTTSVKKFRGELDGKWICFEQRGNNFIYRFDEHCPPGKHTLVVTAADENDNTSRLTYNFTR